MTVTKAINLLNNLSAGQLSTPQADAIIHILETQETQLAQAMTALDMAETKMDSLIDSNEKLLKRIQYLEDVRDDLERDLQDLRDYPR